MPRCWYDMVVVVWNLNGSAEVMTETANNLLQANKPEAGMGCFMAAGLYAGRPSVRLRIRCYEMSDIHFIDCLSNWLSLWNVQGLSAQTLSCDTFLVRHPLKASKTECIA